MATEHQGTEKGEGEGHQTKGREVGVVITPLYKRRGRNVQIMLIPVQLLLSEQRTTLVPSCKIFLLL